MFERYVDNLVTAGSPATIVSAEQVLEAYLNDARFMRNLSPGTLATYTKRVRRFLRWLATSRSQSPDAPIAWPPTRAEVLGYLVGELGPGVSQGTRSGYYTAIHELSGFGRSWFGFDDPTLQVRPPKRPEPHTLSMSQQQVDDFYAACDEWISRVLHRLICGAGLRISECAALRPEDIGRNYISIANGKGGKHRLVVTPPGLIEDIEILGSFGGEAPPWLFFNRRTGGHLRAEELRRKYERAAARARLPRALWLPHIGRHTYATLVAEDGAETGAVQVQLGHASPATTGRYTHQRIAAVAGRLRAANPVRGIAPVGRAQYALADALVPDVPPVQPPETQHHARLFWRTRLWRRVHPDGTPLDLDVAVLAHGLTQRKLAKLIGVSHGAVNGPIHCRSEVGLRFRDLAAKAFAGRYTADELFYQVEEEA